MHSNPHKHILMELGRAMVRARGLTLVAVFGCLVSAASAQLVATTTEIEVVENAPAADDFYQFVVSTAPTAPIDFALSFDTGRLSLTAYQGTTPYPNASAFSFDPNDFAEDPLNPGVADINDPNNFITIVVIPKNDAIIGGEPNTAIVHTISSLDPVYDGDDQTITVKIIDDECFDGPDCNENDISDMCDINPSDPDGDGLVSSDCNGNLVPDECDPDCNENGIPDDCDIDPSDPDGDGTVSLDCDGNGIPDECDTDCNLNGVPDGCDVDPNDPDGDGFVSTDLNQNGIPDECDADCNDNGIPDSIEADCNSDGLPDDCDTDCNNNGTPDGCEFSGVETIDLFQDVPLKSADFVGESVAISGFTAVVGSPGDDLEESPYNARFGSVHVFERTYGNWQAVAKLTAPDKANFDEFGNSVSIDGDRILIGSHLDDDWPAQTNGGSAYIFERIDGDWQFVDKLIPADFDSDDRFGFSVSIHGDTALVGAPRADSTAALKSGVAYVFKWDGSSWQQVAKLEVDDAVQGGRFGHSVSISGTTAIIGANLDDHEKGAAYLFKEVGGVWEFVTKLTSSDHFAFRFGVSVSISDGTAVVGSLRLDPSGESSVSVSGAPEVFELQDGVWQKRASLIAADTQPADLFGSSVAIDGDGIVVGAYRDAPGGSAYSYKRVNGFWYEQEKLTLPGGQQDAEFGRQVAISIAFQVAGAAGFDVYDPNGVESASVGAAYIFEPAYADCNGNGIPDECDLAPYGGSLDCNSNGVPDECETDCNGNGIADECDQSIGPVEKLTKPNGGSRFGASVCVDGDRAIVGAPRDGLYDWGSAYIYKRIDDAWQRVAKLAPLVNPDSKLGRSVAISGDTAFLGAKLGVAGAVYVFEFYDNGWQQAVKLIPNDLIGPANFGASVSTDGVWLIVGAPQNYGNAYESGTAYIYKRVNGQWEMFDKLAADDGEQYDYFGASVSILGEKAVIGAVQDKLDSTAEVGSVSIYALDGEIWQQAAKLTADDGVDGDQFGAAVAQNEDTVVVAAPGNGNGAVYVFERIGEVWQQVAKFSSPKQNDHFGQSVSMSGNRFVVGASTDATGGVVYLYERHAGAWRLISNYTPADVDPDDRFGESVAMSDQTIFAGAPRDDDLGDESGAVYVFPPVLYDCNWNDTPDVCDVDPSDPDGDGVVSADCNGNGTPDECEIDCNNNGIPDSCDVDPSDPDGNGVVSSDCNRNGIPDECEEDCNNNGIPDECDLDPTDPDGDGMVSADCNDNNRPDECDVDPADPDGDGLVSNDCNGNGVPDECELIVDLRAKLFASDAASHDSFGARVAVNGDTAVIGAPNNDDAGEDSGSAYVFQRTGGMWLEVDKLTADDAAAGDNFGCSVAIDGLRIVVGACHDDDNGQDSGSAYVFEPAYGAWHQVAKLTTDDGASSDGLGNSISIDGTTIMVGAADAAPSLTGAVYVFELVGDVWTQVDKLQADDADGDDRFGYSVSVSGDAAIIGAPFDELEDLEWREEGSAYIFERVNGVWQQAAKFGNESCNPFFSECNGANSLLGWSVSISGDAAVAAAFTDTVNEPSQTVPDRIGGPVIVLERVAGNWTMKSFIETEPGFAGNVQVAISGSRFVIGESGYAGSVNLYRFDGSSWNYVTEYNAAEGASVAIAGQTIISGAPGDDEHGSNSGVARIIEPASRDCNGNGIPDECEPDCNGNGVPDDCDIDPSDPDDNGFVSSDENLDGIPDECAFDCNTDDHTDIFDFELLQPCIQGPAGGIGEGCSCFDVNADGEITMVEVWLFQRAFGG